MRFRVFYQTISLLLFLVVSPLSAQAALEFDQGVPQALQTQVIDDLKLLQGLTGDGASPLHREIFGQVSGDAYLQWFQSRVFRFGMGTCGGAASVACQNNDFPHQIFVTHHYVSDSYPQIARLMTLFHEARHTEVENAHWKHRLCSPFYQEKSIWTGQGLKLHFACDRTEYGSYASASVLLRNISRFCINCSAKVKADAELYSQDQIKRVTSARARALIDADFITTETR